MSRARRRTARALAVLRRTVEDGDVAAGLEDLGRWLEEFHPRSLVELDYGGLVHLLDDTALAQDESARDVAAALAALGAGDGAVRRRGVRAGHHADEGAAGGRVGQLTGTSHARPKSPDYSQDGPVGPFRSNRTRS